MTTRWGLCRSCGEQIPPERRRRTHDGSPPQFCSGRCAHRAAQRAYAYRNREAGLCFCGRAPRAGSLYCERCIEAAREWQRANGKRLRARARGHRLCGKVGCRRVIPWPVDEKPTPSLCEEHQAEAVAAARRRAAGAGR